MIRDEILKKVPEGASPEEKARAVSRERARVAVDAWSNYGGRNTKGVAFFEALGGSVSIGHMELDADGEAVLIWTGEKKGHPQYRIVNPPILTEDRQGPVKFTYAADNEKPSTKAFREDPVRAIAEGIASVRGGKLR